MREHCYNPLLVDKYKKSIKMYLTTGWDFSMASKGQKFENYTREFKLEVVKKKLKGVSLTQLAKQYQMTDSMIISWVKKYQELGEDGLISQWGQKSVSNILKRKSKQNFSSVEEENEYLEKCMSKGRSVPIESLDLCSSKNLK